MTGIEKIKTYRMCSVPMCGNSRNKCPDKLFIHVPKSSKRRKLWLQLARRDPKVTPDNSTIYFCEDHFDLPNDMENYIKYSVMGSVEKIRMKPNCLPSKFVCQPDRIKRTAPPKSRSAVSKRRRLEIIQEVMSKETEIPTTSDDFAHADTEKNDSFTNFQNQATQVYPATDNKVVQVRLTVKFRSKAVQTKEKFFSPLKNNITSPLNSAKSDEGKSARFEKKKSREKLLFSSEKFEVSSSSSSLCKPSQSNTDTSPSLQTLLKQTSTSNDQGPVSEPSNIKRNIEAENLCQMAIETTVRLIKNKPKYYIGISKDCFFLIDLIQKHTNLPEEHILLCLKKIRLNTPFSELGDQFGVSTSHASKIFKKSLPLIARKLYPFIIKSNKRAVKRNVLLAFRHEYHNIYCIIDCLETEIQSPSKYKDQVLTWSELKKANTTKYLISCTPDGIINYVSPGYGGGITDVSLVQNSSFLDRLEPGVAILADRGFKHVEKLLLQKGINLIRPPSVSSNCELTNQDVIKIKQIASLMIQIERVMRRLRAFSMLKPHSVVKKQLFKYLDDCVVIACALINLQACINKNA